MVKRGYPSNAAFNNDTSVKRIKYQSGFGPAPNFNVFKAYYPRPQRGGGFGGVFRGIFRRAIPLLKRGLATVGRRALKAGGDVLEDVVVNRTPIKLAVKRRAKTELDELKKQFGGRRSKGINRGGHRRNSLIPARKLKRGGRKKQAVPKQFREITL